ncbi:hypothetical protein RJJ65_11100 [Rhizobium hidalgonense]|uniref:Uncharacterized protein n=1 Tax=Rhizobium hidalgonense TaxID=1538159 RepID=A0AAJ2GVD5_9HYPH|nr:hypothetical protein [Rhizobium hidalgonense]MDR9773203.1 hypothetical protein [Rhizobium hidalgonense]MDR9810501.1 hypothetical protein [Rhizobium hidalgonense]MDR9819128.1 hypothetical protein [Rhizobium hidalgonense]
MNIFAGTIPSASSSSVNSFVQRDQAACRGTATIVVAISGVACPQPSRAIAGSRQCRAETPDQIETGSKKRSKVVEAGDGDRS